MNQSQLEMLSVIGNVQVVRVSNSLMKKDKTSSFNILYLRRTKELEQMRVRLDEAVAKQLINTNIINLDVDTKTGLVQDENVLTIIVSNALLQSLYNKELATGRKNGITDDMLQLLFKKLTLQLNVEYCKEGDTYTDREGVEYSYKMSTLRLRGLGYDTVNGDDDTERIYLGNKNSCKAKELEIATLASVNVDKYLSAKKKEFSGAMWNASEVAEPETETKSSTIAEAVGAE
jgi:hypothetical protein